LEYEVELWRSQMTADTRPNVETDESGKEDRQS